MGAIDQALELIGRAVSGIGRVGEHAVISPVPVPRKIGERHKLDRRHADLGEIGELIRQRRIASFGRRRADMDLVEDRFLKRPPAPLRVRPCVGARVDDQASPLHIIGLKT